jgi:hypothetical protein
MLSVNYICVYKVALSKAKEGESTINSFGEKESLLPVVLLGDVSIALVGHTAATVGQLKHGRDGHVTTLIRDIASHIHTHSVLKPRVTTGARELQHLGHLTAAAHA